MVIGPRTGAAGFAPLRTDSEHHPLNVVVDALEGDRRSGPDLFEAAAALGRRVDREVELRQGGIL
jgi:hypothetical protein